MLRQRGFTCRLATLGGFQPERLRAAIDVAQPQYVLVDLTPYSITAARRTIGAVAGEARLPVAVFGTYATCKPTRAVSIPGVQALVLGEYDRPLVALLEAVREGRDPAGIGGVWLHTPKGLVKGKLPSLGDDLDELPLPDRALFDDAQAGNRPRELPFKAARGCPLWCAYCINDWYMDLYGEKPATFVRRRSVGNLLDEIAQVVRATGGAESVRFYDHGFAADLAWLREFARDYPKRCALPFRCHVRLNHVTPEVAALLAAANGRWVHTQIGSGSPFIRDEIFSMGLTNGQIINACHVLQDAGLHVAVEVFIGAPYESEITVEETLGLLREARVDDVQARVFYPTPGTRAAELCAENGWITGRGEEAYWEGQSVLDMPSMPAEHVEAVMRKFASLVRRPASTALRKLLSKVGRTRKRGIFGLGG